MSFIPTWTTGWELGTTTLPGIQLSSYWSISSSNPHTGAYDLLGSGTAQATLDILPNVGGSYVDFSIWTRWRVDYTYRIRIFFDDSSYCQLIRGYRGGLGYWDIYRSGTLLEEGIVPILSNTYSHLQVRFYVDNTNGYFYTKVDGNPDIAFDGDTQPSTGTTINYIRFIHDGTGSGSYPHLDDMVFGTGGWPGDVRLELLKPNADASPSEWATNSESTAPIACTATASGTAGNLNGDYYYKITFIDAGGETVLGTASNLVQPVNKQVNLSSIPLGPAGTTARRIYRTVASGSTYYFVYELGNNTTTIYTDNTADGNLGHDSPPAAYYELNSVPPDDDDFIWSTSGDQQTYVEMEDWDSTYKIPIGVNILGRIGKFDASSTQARFLVRNGTTVYSGDVQNVLTSLTQFNEIVTTDPDGADWTDTVINSMNIGIESIIP